MMQKDLKLAQDAAAKAGASTPLGALSEALFQLFDRLGCGGRDFLGILQMLRGSLDELPKASAIMPGARHGDRRMEAILDQIEAHRKAGPLAERSAIRLPTLSTI